MPRSFGFRLTVFGLTLAFIGLQANVADAAKKKKKQASSQQADDTTATLTSAPAANASSPPPPPPPPPPDEPPPPPPQRAVAPNTRAETNAAEPYGSGYESWGTRGGATLGTGNGARAQLNAGSPGPLLNGMSYFGFEGMYIFNLSHEMDLGVGGRFPLWLFGLAPGAELRLRVLNMGQFQMAISGGLYLPLIFSGIGTFGLGVSFEPGVMASYFVRDNMEVFFGLVIPISPLFIPNVLFDIAFDLRGGFAYTLKRSNIGFYGELDLVPGYGPNALTTGAFLPFGVTTAFGSGFLFGVNFTGGVQFRL